jgi:hypothetical protein
MPADPDRRPLGEFLDLLAARLHAPGAGATVAMVDDVTRRADALEAAVRQRLP